MGQPRRNFVAPGDKFGRLEVLEEIEPRNGHRRAACRCRCGEEKVVAIEHLVDGHATSCGCARREMLAEKMATHGHCRGDQTSPEYRTWCHMRRRCLDPTHKNWPDYGARGITVCDEWQNDFAEFLAHVGPRPGPGYSLERIDNDRGYEPGNVRWATRKEQMRNTRSNLLLTLGARTKTVVEWAELAGIDPQNVYNRLRLGWPPAEALCSPLGTKLASFTAPAA